ncbi:MAG TPA: LPS-assembly protein LptD [Casimicrobiaceae bacterium]|nr:LPS-assembly protein LptD [Casimicrobiaceae bacterium]
MASRSRLWLALAAASASAIAPSHVVAQTAEPGLRMARELAPPGPPVDPQTRRRAPFTLDSPDQGRVFLRADRLEGTQSRVEASGRVELRARRETVLADFLSYDLETQEITGRGNVLLRQGNDFVTGPELTFKRDAQTGAFASPRFGVGELGARGDAERVTFLGPNLYQIVRGRVTTCVAPRDDWFLRAELIDLDTEKKVGIARNARLDFMGLPILYSPYLEFPLSDDRKSGFLTPTIGSSGVRGMEVALPYYFNLAPNYDATVTPRIMTKRGLQIGGELRYLFDHVAMPNQGQAYVEVLPEDRQTNTTRWLYSLRHNHQFTPWLAGYLNLNRVSDDKYFADLSERVSVTSQSTLVREGGLSATFGPLNVLVRAEKFQTLQDPNAPITPPYDRVPQLLATLPEAEWAGIAFSGFAEYARFKRPGFETTDGARTVVHPQLEWRRQGPAWFFAARGSVHARKYDLRTPLPDGERSPDVIVPIASLDTGFIFEREITTLGANFVQTLEPRAFYVNIPAREQNNLPVFDSALDDFNFSQLFTENRYLGNDRIGDANQLTVALTSRLLNAGDGSERLRFLVGQRFYFKDQRVTLPNETPRGSSSSDVLLGFEGRLSEAWLVNSLVQVNLDSGNAERFNIGARWNPEPGKVFAASYRYTRRLVDPVGSVSNLKQFDVATQWPISAQWTLLGRWNYSIVQSKTLEALIGFEYNADCWILRAVAHRLTTTSQQTSTSVYLQLELNGLARLGTSPLDLLRRSVPGFLRSNDPARRDRGVGIDPYPEF